MRNSWIRLTSSPVSPTQIPRVIESHGQTSSLDHHVGVVTDVGVVVSSGDELGSIVERTPVTSLDVFCGAFSTTGGLIRITLTENIQIPTPTRRRSVRDTQEPAGECISREVR